MLTIKQTLRNAIGVSFLTAILWGVFGWWTWRAPVNAVSIVFLSLLVISVVLLFVFRGKPILDKGLLNDSMRVVIWVVCGVLSLATVVYLIMR